MYDLAFCETRLLIPTPAPAIRLTLACVQSYKYKKKEELPETSIAGIKLDPRVRALAVLSTLAVIPIFPVAIFVVSTTRFKKSVLLQPAEELAFESRVSQSTPGSGASPFKFLDFLFPPAIEGKKKREAAAAAAKAKAGKK